MIARRLVLPFVAVAATTALAFAIRGPLARWFETPPSLAEATLAVRAGRFDDAERLLGRILDDRPDHRDANLLLAQVLIDRDNPRPADALVCLDRIRTRDRQLLAVIRVQRGKALYQLHRFAEAERSWIEARELNPTVPEAGWLLIQQYYLQGRDEEVARLALELHAIETDPVDRVRLLLEPIREDVERLAAAGVISWLEPVVKANPEDRASAIALGRALVKEGRVDEGSRLLSKAVADAPDDPAGWEAWLGALSDAGDVDALERELGRLPASVAGRPEMAAHRGRLAQERRRYDEAVAAYEEALRARPDDPRLLFRLGRTLRLSRRDEEARAVEEKAAVLDAASRELKDAYREAKALPTLGVAPEPALYQRLATLRERLGKPAEALAWHRLVLQSDPRNPASRRAVERLAGTPPDAR